MTKSLHPVYATYLQVFDGIDLLLKSNLTFPALVLIYSGIDSVAWLGSNIKGDQRRQFTEWVDRYLFPARPLGCNSIDLYAARCALLHRLASTSDLTDSGRAVRLGYKWRTSNMPGIEAFLHAQDPAQLRMVVLEDLAEGFREGTRRMFDEALKDSALRDRIEARGDDFFASYPNE